MALVDLNDSGGIDQYDPSKVTAITLPNGVIRTTYDVPNVLLRQDQLPPACQSQACDVLITVPTFKNHGQAGMTVALKNRVGCAPSDIYYDRQAGLRPNMKRELVHTLTWPRNVSGDVPPATSDEKLLVRYTQVDLNLVRPQDFVLVDGLIGITNGPTGTNQCSPWLGLIMAGRDSVAIDTVSTLIAQYDPAQLQQLYWADRRGLGTKDTAYINVVGSHVADVKYAFPDYYGGSYPLPDKTSPTMTGLTPANNSTVSGIVPITGSGVSDNVGVVKAELEIDGQLTAVNRTSPYASFTWDTGAAAPGPHTVKVTVYDASLNERSIANTVNVSPPSAVVDFSANPTSGNGPLTVQFTDLSVVPGASQWYWEFGDGQTSTAQHPSHTYVAFGAFHVRLTVTGTGGPVTAQKSNYINVTAVAPHAAFTADVTSGYKPLTVHFADQSTGDVTGWSWSFGDGATSTAQNPTHAYTQQGTFTVTLTVSGPTGMSDTLARTAYIEVRSMPGDFDNDSDVDIDDFGKLQSCFNGPNRPAACL